MVYSSIAFKGVYMALFDYVLFDLDGTVSNTQEGIFKSIDYAMDKMGMPRMTAEEMKKYIGPPLTVSFVKFLGMDDDAALKCLNAYRERYDAAGVRECCLYDGIKEVMLRLKKAGVKIALATSKPQEPAEAILKMLGIYDIPDFIAGATLDERRNTKAKVIEYALQGLGNPDRKRTVLIGDRCYDAEGAEKAGINCIGVTYGFGTKDEFEKYGVNLIADSPEDILRILKV